MIKRILAGIAAAGITVTALALPAHASTRPVNWTQRTCNAFAAYESHPGKLALERVVADSFHVSGYGKPGLASDIGQLWADSAGGGRKYLPADNEYIRDDCGGAN